MTAAWLRSDPWPGNPICLRAAKKEKKQTNKKTRTIRRVLISSLSSHTPKRKPTSALSRLGYNYHPNDSEGPQTKEAQRNLEETLRSVLKCGVKI